MPSYRIFVFDLLCPGIINSPLHSLIHGPVGPPALSTPPIQHVPAMALLIQVSTNLAYFGSVVMSSLVHWHSVEYLQIYSIYATHSMNGGICP